jgi:hypothetical protein
VVCSAPPLGRSRNSPGFALIARRGLAALSAAVLGGAILAACGGGTRQDANEPSGDFPVQITRATFPGRQQLAVTTNLVLVVQNTGQKPIPDLAITISTDPHADESFSVRSPQQGLAIPSRPAWVLEQGYPKLLGETAPAGAETAESKTYSFGPLPAGASKAMVWRVTPSIAGTYTVDYRVAAGLEGKAKAVTADGSIPEGQFAVVISDVPPQTHIDASGQVVPIKPGDVIGGAGTPEKSAEAGSGTGTTANGK